MAGDVQDVIALLGEGGVNFGDAAPLQNMDEGLARSARSIGGIEDASQFRFHIEKLAAGVLRFRAADRDKDAQRAGNGERGCRTSDIDMPVERNAGMDQSDQRPGFDTNVLRPRCRLSDARQTIGLFVGPCPQSRGSSRTTPTLLCKVVWPSPRDGVVVPEPRPAIAIEVLLL
jgi:hypothetical protein